MAENDVVVVELPELGKRIDLWKSYAFNSDFLSPTDGWDFTFGDDETGDDFLRELLPGVRVTLKVNDAVQGDGYIDEVDIQSGRGGTEVSIHGRDLLAPVVDSHLDPTVGFKTGQSLEDVLKAVFTPFGFTLFDIDNDANRDVLKGQKRGQKRPRSKSSTGSPRRRKSRNGKALSSYQLHQLRPYPREGAFAFAARLAQRHGLWIWLGADAKTIVVGQPDFEQDPSGSLIRKRGSGLENNIIQGSVKRSALDQPSCIVATGRSGGGEHPYSGMRVIAVNGLVRADTSAVTKKYGSALKTKYLTRSGTITADRKVAVAEAGSNDTSNKYGDPRVAVLDGHSAEFVEKWPGAKVIGIGEDIRTKYNVSQARPLFLEDQESGSIEQLEYFARREMALRQRKGFDVHYTVEGHESDDGVWTVDTIVDVDDDVLDIHEPMYVLGRTLYKSRGAGTYTQLSLCRVGALLF